MKRAITIIVVLAIWALAAPAALAAHTATVGNLPGTANPTTSTDFTMTVTNDVGSGSAIDIVELVVDADWTVPSSQPAPPTNWEYTVLANTITWTTTAPAGRIDTGISVDFSWTATTGPAELSTHNWTTTDVPNATDTGTFDTQVGPVTEFPHGLLIPLAIAALVYIWMRTRFKKRGELR